MSRKLDPIFDRFDSPSAAGAMNRFLTMTLTAILLACAEAPPFDSAAFLRSQYAERLGEDAAARLEVPFELQPDVLAAVDGMLRLRGDERHRAQQIVDLIFGSLGLEYALFPTRTGSETFRARQGNCLSFVNLFLGLARHAGLNPTYVEVVDRQGWSYRQGMVVSHGHIVAGLMIEGELETYDFLPYRPKTYRDLRPLEDRLAVAHFYNNLGAEALLTEDPEAAAHYLAVVEDLAPDFVGGLNNLGICQARLGQVEAAFATYRRGLELEPENVGLLTNLARLHQQRGKAEVAQELLAKARATRQVSPFFHVSQGERALARGDLEAALDSLREALRLDSEVPEVHLGLVKLYLALGHLERARHHLGRASKLDPTHPGAEGYRDILAEGTP